MFVAEDIQKTICLLSQNLFHHSTTIGPPKDELMSNQNMINVLYFSCDSQVGIPCYNMRIYRMPDPDRGQGILPFQPVERQTEDMEQGDQ